MTEHVEDGVFRDVKDEVFRQAVRVMVESSTVALANAGLKPSDVDVVIPHQANVRIIESACNKLGIPMDKAVVNLPTTGNTSAASIPLALVDGITDGRVKDGDIVLLVGFGAGMTSASAVLRCHRGRPGGGLAGRDDGPGSNVTAGLGQRPERAV